MTGVYPSWLFTDNDSNTSSLQTIEAKPQNYLCSKKILGGWDVAIRTYMPLNGEQFIAPSFIVNEI